MYLIFSINNVSITDSYFHTSGDFSSVKRCISSLGSKCILINLVSLLRIEDYDIRFLAFLDISLVDADGHEKAIIRDIENLMPDSRKAIEDSLDEYYLIPKISAILERQEKYGILKWTVMTDRGVRSFDIRNIYRDIKLLYDGRALIRDSDDNRYEIPDIKKLDAKSMSLLALDT